MVALDFDYTLTGWLYPPSKKARDANNHDRHFGGDEFEVSVFHLMAMDDKYDKAMGPDHEDGSTSQYERSREGLQKSRVAVRHLRVSGRGN